jgi:transcriptional regulator with XRE-family HTH domain
MPKRRKEELPPEIAEKFQKNLIRLREEAGLDRAELEERAGLDEGRVARFEDGEELPGTEDNFRLGGALGVDPGLLFAGFRWSPPADGGNGFELDPPDGSDEQSPS